MGLKSSHFFWLLVARPSMTIPEVLQRINQYILAEIMIQKVEIGSTTILVDPKRPSVDEDFIDKERDSSTTTYTEIMAMILEIIMI
ncbi:hypothetical protein C4D60_Mb07t04720 [Musa balbisiana]|uniref:Uncharacterized protein n=1 Tax=Musa balbisiana TaxID=52838 RepID=A0A4S8JD67_MUSBA|nr:hypothetical protein C4D60_Mb07t04720 [Musa balbisiana]